MILVWLASLLLAAAGGYFTAKGQCSASETKTISAAVKDLNEDQAELIPIRNEVRAKENESIKTIIQIKRIPVDVPCPLPDVIQLQQSIYKAFPKMPVQ